MCWWLPAMTYPTGFLTAVLQVSARMNGLSIDSLSYETPVQISGCVLAILCNVLCTILTLIEMLMQR